MTPPRRRSRRSRGAGQQAAGDGVATQPGGTQHRQRGANWTWRTFPVYFGFSLGIFIGLYLGLWAAWLEREGNDVLYLGIFVTVAIMLGLGLSRLTTNWLVKRRTPPTKS